MLGYVVVFVGAGVGGTMRHAMNIWIARVAGTHFPYHTLAINITGSMVMGMVTAWFAMKGGASGAPAALPRDRHTRRLHDLLCLLPRRCAVVGAA